MKLVKGGAVPDRPFEMAGRPGFEFPLLAQRLTRFRFVELFPCHFLVGADRCLSADSTQDTAVIVGAIKLAEPNPPSALVLPLRTRSLASSDLVGVGRSAWSDVVIADARVSRRHALFRLGRVQLLLEDAGSSNGTFVENLGLREGDPVPVEEGETIRFATTALRLVGPADCWEWLRGGAVD